MFEAYRGKPALTRQKRRSRPIDRSPRVVTSAAAVCFRYQKPPRCWYRKRPLRKYGMGGGSAHCRQDAEAVHRVPVAAHRPGERLSRAKLPRARKTHWALLPGWCRGGRPRCTSPPTGRPGRPKGRRARHRRRRERAPPAALPPECRRRRPTAPLVRAEPSRRSGRTARARAGRRRAPGPRRHGSCRRRRGRPAPGGRTGRRRLARRPRTPAEALPGGPPHPALPLPLHRGQALAHPDDVRRGVDRSSSFGGQLSQATPSLSRSSLSW
ncbi:hypothetical protein SAMN05661080_04563 [Modestobacter sp. DSM 44400]|nr:hypothetical protein SAMN05661080_04563 [Modestobacter sp. DSM 44400]